MLILKQITIKLRSWETSKPSDEYSLWIAINSSLIDVASLFIEKKVENLSQKFPT